MCCVRIDQISRLEKCNVNLLFIKCVISSLICMHEEGILNLAIVRIFNLYFSIRVKNQLVNELFQTFKMILLLRLSYYDKLAPGNELTMLDFQL